MRTRPVSLARQFGVELPRTRIPSVQTRSDNIARYKALRGSQRHAFERSKSGTSLRFAELDSARREYQRNGSVYTRFLKPPPWKRNGVAKGQHFIALDGFWNFHGGKSKRRRVTGNVRNFIYFKWTNIRRDKPAGRRLPSKSFLALKGGALIFETSSDLRRKGSRVLMEDPN